MTSPACESKHILYGDVDLCITDGHGLVSCNDCGEWIEQKVVRRYQLAQPDRLLALCDGCFVFRLKIEDCILELLYNAPGNTLASDKIHEALERFGVPKELTEAARQRMHRDGRLVYGEPGGRT